MTETLIVNGVVIANGIADSDGDVLDKKDIKTIFSKYQRDTDTMHKNIKNDGVEVFASWISEVDSVIDNKPVPAGSWLCTMKVTNQTLIKCIEEGKLNGFSLGSVSKEAMTPKYWFINKSLNYRDLKDMEEVIPLFISFVDRPANQYDFEVMSYDAYINKKEKDVEEMTEANNDEMISVSALEKIRGLFINKAEEEPVAEATATEETSTDETVSALFEKLDKIIEQNNAILESINKEEEDEESEEDESVDEEEEIEKAEEDTKEEDESSEEPSEEETEEEDKEIEKEESESSEEANDDDSEEDVNIDKRETSMIENQSTERITTFYQKTGRDSFGRKIKQ